MSSALDLDEIESEARLEYQRLTDSVHEDSIVWQLDIPGRRVLLNRFAHKANIQTGRLKILYLRAALAAPKDPFSDVVRIFEEFRGLPSLT